MTWHLWPLFALTITVASISPGPNVLIVVVKALKYGRKGAVWTILGNLACLFFIALLASVGVGAAMAAAPHAFQIMKVAGGLYLAWQGVKLIRSSFRKMGELRINADDASSGPFSRSALFTEAFLVSASNPKSILFLSAVFPQFLDAARPVAPQFAIMFTTIIGLVTVIHGTYALLAITMRDRPVSQRFRQWAARVTGTTFIGLGAGVALSR